VEKSETIQHYWNSLDAGKQLTLNIPSKGIIYVQTNQTKGLNKIELVSGTRRYKIQGQIPNKSDSTFEVELEVDPYHLGEFKVRISEKDLQKVYSNSLITGYSSKLQSQNP